MFLTFISAFFYSTLPLSAILQLKRNFLGAEDSDETKILRAKISARVGRDEEVENFLRKSDFGDSEKIIRAILLKSKGRNEEAFGLIEAYLQGAKR